VIRLLSVVAAMGHPRPHKARSRWPSTHCSVCRALANVNGRETCARWGGPVGQLDRRGRDRGGPSAAASGEVRSTAALRASRCGHVAGEFVLTGEPSMASWFCPVIAGLPSGGQQNCPVNVDQYCAARDSEARLGLSRHADWLDAIRVEGVRHEHWFGDGVRHHWLLLLARLVPPPVIASGTGRLTSLAAAPDRQLRDARSQRPSALTASTSARPGGCMRPAAIRASTLATFTADQLLRGRRGVYRCRK
jgi:hypothetical protein